MNQVFVTSDWHFGHKNIIKYCNRPFQGVADMDPALIEIWNAQVNPQDAVYFLGDFTFDREHSKTDGALVALLGKLNGNKIFVLGNHDNHIEGKLRAAKVRGISQVWDVVPYLEVRHNGRKLVMFHYPITEWNGSHHNTVHLHGHCHGSRKDLPGRLLDVGIDAHPEFKLWTLDEAIEAADANFEKTKESFIVHQTGE